MSMKASSSSKLSTYYRLTKPGIIYGNVMTTLAGFLFAGTWGRESFDISLLLATVFGTSLVIASACVANNYIDRDIDRAMERTKKRALVIGDISGRNAVIFSTVLAIIGFGLLLGFVNGLTAAAGAVAFIDYVVLYGWSKRKSVHGTLVGSVSGAIPILAGYTAASGKLDLTAVLLFAVMTVWQMPHFYAIAIYRSKEYAAAHIPVLPLVKGVEKTKRQIMVYIGAYLTAIVVLWLVTDASLWFSVPAVAGAGWWLLRSNEGYRTMDSSKWARKVFFQSLTVLMLLSAGLALDGIFR